jgi:metal-responsive CopG/Arc/MetJ family transcriptional regulator
MRRGTLDHGTFHGYTKGMKTAVSIPDEVFQDAERLARRTKKSRSQLFSDALSEYVARHAPEEVTEAMDRVVAAIGESSDEFVSTAALRVLDRTEW